MRARPADVARLREAACRIVFVLIVAAGAIWPHEDAFVTQRPERALRYDLSAGLQYVEFLEEVHQRTRPGEHIFLVFPSGRNQGYAFAFYFANYFLSGRRVLPMLDERDHWVQQNLSNAEAVAAWHYGAPPGYSIVWRGRGGCLARRRP